VLAVENSRRGLGREDGGFVCNGGLGEEVLILEEERRFFGAGWDWEGAMWLGWKRGTRVLLCGCFPCGVERRPRMARCSERRSIIRMREIERGASDLAARKRRSC